MKNLITLDCEQGSDAWRQARLGIPTASQYKRIMTNSGAASEQATAYLAELIAERITGQPADGYTSDDMARGTKLEPQARAAYEFATGNSVQQIGGEVLVVSQFTLAADTQKGLRPSFSKGAPPALANALYDYFVQKCGEKIKVETGRFAADMQVSLTNDGPVTFWLNN